MEWVSRGEDCREALKNGRNSIKKESQRNGLKANSRVSAARERRFRSKTPSLRLRPYNNDHGHDHDHLLHKTGSRINCQRHLSHNLSHIPDAILQRLHCVPVLVKETERYIHKFASRIAFGWRVHGVFLMDAMLPSTFQFAPTLGNKLMIFVNCF